MYGIIEKEVKSMKGSRESLTNYLTSQFEKDMRNKKDLKHIIDYMVNDCNFPVLEVVDAVHLRMHTEDCSDRMLYWFLKVIDEKRIPTYFSLKEAKEYEATTYKRTDFKFPIRWNMVEVVEGSQWIGKISVKELMKLRNAQLINYNERTQRTLKRVVNKDFEYYQISLNRSAVEAIANSFLTNQYIPNTITLNMPEDSDFRYADGKLIISHADRLDILDGYHRYIAMSNLYNQNNKFDYTMELRVVCFPEETAKQFIWQEDQKTKMRKMDSESFNQNSPANQVVNLVNQNGLLRNIIGRNEGIIDQGLASNLIDRVFFNTTKVINRKMILEVRDIIIDRMNAMLTSNPDIFEKRWDYEFTVIAFALMGNAKISNNTLLNDIIRQTNLMCETPEYKIMLGKKGNPVTTKIITRVNKFYEDFIVKEV